ncbi:MAG: hypothetical protein D6734_04080 [Candidatus Schekmanbacteria bacterium]|nr:MAG: hypothetical protein D6734_04080 [Candidatus Schekmanbacteria bacterium]
MIKINLLPIEDELKQAKATQEVIVYFAAVLITILALFLHNSSLSSELSSVRKEINEINNKINSMKEVENLHKTIQQKKAQIAAKLAAVKKVTESQVTYVRHLDEMQNIIPKGVWLNSLSFTGSTAVFECKSSSYYEISEFYNRLKNSDFFIVENFPSIIEGSPEGGIPVYKFKITSALQNLKIETAQAKRDNKKG